MDSLKITALFYFRIFGVPCVLASLKVKKSLPNWDVPLYCLSMSNLVITTSGLEKEKKVSLASVCLACRDGRSVATPIIKTGLNR